MAKYIEIGIGKVCPKCNKPTVTRKRMKKPNFKDFFYVQWDFCKQCNSVYFEEKYKSAAWQEQERQQSFFNSLRKENEDTN